MLIWAEKRKVTELIFLSDDDILNDSVLNQSYQAVKKKYCINSFYFMNILPLRFHPFSYFFD